MTISKVEKPAWHAYLDQVSKTLTGKRVEIEVDALNIGQQIEAKWLPLWGIVYDQKNDLIEVILDGLDHMITKPQELYVDHNLDNVTSFEVVDADNTRQIIKLHDPIMLPPP
jgi:hypothetical protein